MENAYIELMRDVETYIHKKENIDLINKAYLFAKDKHDGQFRKSGLPYIIHPIEVTQILAKLNAGPNTLCAGLLHDVVEDTDVSLEEIAELFGDDIAILVDGLTKVSQLKFSSLKKQQAENHQKMLLAMCKDIRVIIIKLADRLHNMRTMDAMPEDKRVRISKETLEIYAPLAHKLGMFKIKGELEDRSLRYIEPDTYNKIDAKSNEKKNGNVASVYEMIDKLKVHLNDENVPFEIKGRVKNTYSIFKKMTNQNKEFEEIYDILAIRVIVDKIENCYRVLGVVHAHFTPVPKRFKDYISVPKQNMYQSLHTTIIGSFGETYEIQIRTKEMDDVAEMGIAAHWSYKENVVYSKEKEQFEIAQKLKWYADLLTLTNEDVDIVEAVKGDILDANIYVYTPTGEVVPLCKGATPLDFAYKIHTDLGHKTVGALVNGKIVPLTYELQTGDIITMKTSKIPNPNDDWMHIVKSSYAKHKIRTFLNKLNKDDLIQRGKDDIDRELSNSQREHEDLNDAFVYKHFGKNQLKTVEDLYYEIGKGVLSPKTVEQKLFGGVTHDKETILQRQMEKSNRLLTTNSSTGVVVEGLTNPQIKLGACCCPIPGDVIYGYVSKSNGLVVHRENCDNFDTLEKERMLNIDWASNITRKYPVKIKITSILSTKILTEVVTTINANGINLASIAANNNSKFETIIKLKILVSDLKELNHLLVNLQKLSDISKIERT